MKVLKVVRYLSGATARRKKRYMVKLVKNASDCDVDVVVHLDIFLSRKDVFSV